MQTQVRHACRALVSTTNRRTSWSPPNARESNLSEASSAPMPAIKLTRASSQYPAVRTCHGRVMVCPGTSKKTACKSGNMRSSRWTNNSPPARARGGVSVDSMMISLRAEPPQSATAAGAVCRERGVLTGEADSCGIGSVYRCHPAATGPSAPRPSCPTSSSYWAALPYLAPHC